VGAEGDDADEARMPAEDRLRRAVRRVPRPHGAVLGRGGDPRSVVAVGDSLDTTFVPAQGLEALSAARVPRAHRPVVAADDDARPAGVERHGVVTVALPVDLPAELPERFLAAGLPHLQLAFDARRGDELAVAAERGNRDAGVEAVDRGEGLLLPAIPHPG